MIKVCPPECFVHHLEEEKKNGCPQSKQIALSSRSEGKDAPSKRREFLMLGRNTDPSLPLLHSRKEAATMDTIGDHHYRVSDLWLLSCVPS